MNPITNAKNLNKLNERELNLGLTGSKTSWHSLYEGSAWIFVGGLAYDLTEGDIIAVFSQYGEIVNLNFVRDKKTGKPKGYCFICYEDQRSTILAVDNFSGIKLLNRILRVDHVQDYKIPKEFGDEDEVTRLLRNEGCGPNVKLITEVKTEKLPSAEKTDKKKVKQERLEDPEDDERRRQDERPREHRGRKVELHNESKLGTVKVKEEPVDSQYDKYNRRDDESLRDKKRSEKRDDIGVDDESEKSYRTEHRPKDRREDSSRQEQNEKQKKSSEKRATVQSSSSLEDYNSRGIKERTSTRDGRDRSYGGCKEHEEADVRRPVEDDRDRSKKRQTESNTYESGDRNRKQRDEGKHSRVDEKSSDYSERKGQKRDGDMRSHHVEKSYGGDSRRNTGRQEETAAERSNEQYDSPGKKSRDHTRKDQSKDRNLDSCKRRSRSSSSDEYDRKKRRN